MNEYTHIVQGYYPSYPNSELKELSFYARNLKKTDSGVWFVGDTIWGAINFFLPKERITNIKQIERNKENVQHDNDFHFT